MARFKVGQTVWYPIHTDPGFYTQVSKWQRAEIVDSSYGLYVFCLDGVSAYTYPDTAWADKYCRPTDPIDTLIEAVLE